MISRLHVFAVFFQSLFHANSACIYLFLRWCVHTWNCVFPPSLRYCWCVLAVAAVVVAAVVVVIAIVAVVAVARVVEFVVAAVATAVS